jgi:hypothetical protein
MYVCKWGGHLTDSCAATISWSSVHPCSLNPLADLCLHWSTLSCIAGSHSCLLSFPGLADTISSPRWYTRTTGSLLRGINFQMEALCWRAPLCGFLHSLFNFSCSILSHRKWGTFVFSTSLGWLTPSAPRGGVPELLTLLRGINFKREALC